MIAVSFRDRSKFLQWASKHIFPFKEVYDLTFLEGKYDTLLTDISEIPDNFRGRVLYIGDSEAPPCSIKVDTFDQFLEYIPTVTTQVTPDQITRKNAEIFTFLTQVNQYELDKSSIVVATLPLTQEDRDMFTESVTEPAPAAVPVANSIQSESDTEIFEDSPVEELPEPLDIPEPAVEPQPTPVPTPIPTPQPVSAQKYTPPQEAYTSAFQQPVQAPYVPPYQSAPPPPPQQQVPAYQPAPRAYVPQVQPVNHMAPPQTSQQLTPARRASRATLARGHAQTNVSRVGNVAAFFGVTPKSGVSGLVYMLASYLASVDPSKQILVIDLDINQPGLTSMLINGFHLDPMVDTNVINMASLPDNDLSSALNSLVYEIQLDPVATEYSHIHCIFNTNISFADKRALSGWDFSTRIQQLSMYYDYVLVDCGRLQSTANYQLYMLRSNFQKIFVASGMTHASIQEFVNCLTGMTIDYKVVLNRTNRNITGAAIQRNLGRDIISTIPNIVAIESLIRQGRTANSFGDRGFISNLDQLRDGLGF